MVDLVRKFKRSFFFRNFFKPECFQMKGPFEKNVYICVPSRQVPKEILVDFLQGKNIF